MLSCTVLYHTHFHAAVSVPALTDAGSEEDEERDLEEECTGLDEVVQTVKWQSSEVQREKKNECSSNETKFSGRFVSSRKGIFHFRFLLCRKRVTQQ